VFGTGVRIGKPAENIGGLSDSVDAPRFSTVVGLALYGANRVAIGGASASGKKKTIGSPNMDRLAQRLKTWLQDFF
jgi:cell division protein FtsA